MSRIHQISNRKDLSKIVFIDKDSIDRERRENEAFAKSPNTSKLQQIKIHNTIFFCRKNESETEARERIEKKFNKSII